MSSNANSIVLDEEALLKELEVAIRTTFNMKDGNSDQEHYQVSLDLEDLLRKGSIKMQMNKNPFGGSAQLQTGRPSGSKQPEQQNPKEHELVLQQDRVSGPAQPQSGRPTGGEQPGPQNPEKRRELVQQQVPVCGQSQPQTSRQPGPQRVPSGVVDQKKAQKIAFEAKCSTIRYHIELIEHANKCKRREKGLIRDNYDTCYYPPDCAKMKKTLKHLQSCSIRTNCPVRYCTRARKIITHRKNCSRRDCIFCQPIEQCKMKIRSINPTIKLSSRDEQRVHEAFRLLTVHAFKTCSKGCNQSVEPDTREDIFFTVKDILLPDSDFKVWFDPRLYGLVTYVIKVETNAYEAANSTSEYYLLLTEKILMLKNELRERRLKRVAEASRTSTTIRI